MDGLTDRWRTDGKTDRQIPLVFYRSLPPFVLLTCLLQPSFTHVHTFVLFMFLDASSHLCSSVCPSVTAFKNCISRSNKVLFCISAPWFRIHRSRDVYTLPLHSLVSWLECTHSFGSHYSFIRFLLLASLARSAALAHLFAPELVGQWSIFGQFSMCPESLWRVYSLKYVASQAWQRSLERSLNCSCSFVSSLVPQLPKMGARGFPISKHHVISFYMVR